MGFNSVFKGLMLISAYFSLFKPILFFFIINITKVWEIYDCDSRQCGQKNAESGFSLNPNILRSKPFNDTEEGMPPLPKSPHVATEITTKQKLKITVIHTLIQLKQ